MMASLARCIRLPSILLRRHCQFQCVPSLPLLLPQSCATSRVSCSLAALTATPGHSKRLAVTSIGGARNLSVNFTFTWPQFDQAVVLKKEEARYQHTHVKILPNRPTHAYQPRTEYVKKLNTAIRPNRWANVVVAAYIKGEPASGKTQVAREFGECYYRVRVQQKVRRFIRRILGRVPKSVTVATLYARSESAFSRSFLRLAVDLGCPFHGLQSASTLEEKLTVYSAEVRQKLKESSHKDWLIIIDGMTTKMQNKFRPYLPQPGSDDWGRGAIIVTTNEDQVIPHTRSVVEVKKLREKDAVKLLRLVSERSDKGEHVTKIVKSEYVKRYPLDIVSAGLYIKATKCTFERFLQQLPEIYTKATRIPVLSTGGYGDTPISAIAKAAQQFVEFDASLKKVFTVFAAAPHEPIPMNVICRFMGIKPNSDSQEIDAIKNCGLISRNPEWGEDEPQDSHDTIAALHVHNRTREGLREEFLENDETDTIIQEFTRSLIQECEEPTHDTPPTSNTWTKQMLFPHLMQFFKEGKRFAIDRSLRVQLGVALSNAYINLNQNPDKAKNILSGLLGSLANEENTSITDLTPRERAQINSSFARAYRYLGQYGNSIKILTQALKEKDLDPIGVADILKEFCSTVPSFGEYQESRELLKKALIVFKDTPQKSHLVEVEALSSLAYLCLKMGDWKEGNKHLRKAEETLEKEVSNDTMFDLTAHENLAVAYSELGQHAKSIMYLEELGKHTEETFGPNHPALAVPLARLSAAHYYNRDRKKSESCAKRALMLQRPELDIHIPWNGMTALQILSTTVCDFGDVARANEFELIGKITDYNRGSEESLPAEWSTKLLHGRVYRLLGDQKQAQWTLEAALKESEKAYGSNHIRVGKILTYLGKVYQEQWYLTQALEAFERSHRIHMEFYGSQGHPEVAFVHANRAMILQRAGDHDRGLTMMEEAIKICAKNLEDPALGSIRPACLHIRYAQILANYGIILRDMKEPRKLKEAKEQLEKALEIQRKILAEKSLKRIRSEYALGTVYHGLANYELKDESHKQEHYDKAQNQMEKALDLIDSIGVKHPYRGRVSTGLARLMFDMKQYSPAQEHAEEALNILTNSRMSGDEIHPHVGYCYQILGDVISLGESHDQATAQDYYHKAHDVYRSLIDRETIQMERHKGDFGNVTFFEAWKRRHEEIRKKTVHP